MKQLRIIALVILEHGDNQAFSTGRLFQCFMKNLWEGCQLYKESLHFPLTHLSKVLEITALGIFHVYKIYSYLSSLLFYLPFPSLPPASFPPFLLPFPSLTLLFESHIVRGGLSSSYHPSLTSQVLGSQV